MNNKRYWILVILFLFFSKHGSAVDENKLTAFKNGGYEEWKDGKMPDGWFRRGEGFDKTEDAFKGKFAVKLNNWYEDLTSAVETGSEDKEGWETPGYPFAVAPNKLTGYYKYLGNAECEQARAEVVFYKTSERDSKFYEDVGTVRLPLPPVKEYSRFELKIPADKIPKETERVSVRFETEGRCESGTNECCFLYLDEIRLVDHP